MSDCGYFATSFLVPLFMDEAATDLVVDYFSALSPNECATGPVDTS